MDMVSMSYNVKNYYEEPEPVVTLHLRNSALPPAADNLAITPTLGLQTTRSASRSIRRKRSLSAGECGRVKVPIGRGDGLKVLFGSLLFPKEEGGNDEKRQPFSVPGFTVATTTTDAKNDIVDETLGALCQLRRAQPRLGHLLRGPRVPVPPGSSNGGMARLKQGVRRLQPAP
ncbi:fg-gap repeat-containing protein [Apiospora phragmitis]|uniref:Fg-gap repeat-containing protein n=1 Tax=Apiospora phragmitis TaxID=2905665 RepID=A0ABR1SVH1_9PEZI